ncbi:hypothetical protein PybrP1_001910 [[Pythium] brassicae (nom. inval.)]|nr:hypothetical protein PybrP1_001910 [[Pythium] brassicae (nom. inval.)]
MKILSLLTAAAVSKQLLVAAAPDPALMDVYTRGALLHDVQLNRVFNDSKHFVDMPLKNTSSAAAIPQAYSSFLAQVGAKWGTMTQTERAAQLKVFLDQHFDEPGTDMVAVEPIDYKESTLPPAIAAIASPAFRDWALGLHKLWKVLGRVPQEHVVSSFLHTTTLPQLPRPQNMRVVPGGRFRESYYWDSYWIVQGLLVSNMKYTARSVVNNLLEYVAEYGFVPNGGRIYYLTRSQPPLLADMVRVVAEAGKPESGNGAVDLGYLRVALPILEKEYKYWMQEGPSSHIVKVQANGGPFNWSGKREYTLNRYVATVGELRPESYREDFSDAERAFGNATNMNSDELKKNFFNEIIAAAESGWDFSSRWFRDGTQLTTIDTSNVVPVELNVILYRVERNLAHFHKLLGNAAAAKVYAKAADARADAVQAVFWHAESLSWRDYLLDSKSLSPAVSASNYSPLWAPDLVQSLLVAEAAVTSLRRSGLLQPGGIQTTTTVTGQQWDAPNAWPPVQDMVIEGLLSLKSSLQAQLLARDLMRTCVRASYVGWKHTGQMFEKHNATVLGGIGMGGEYTPQVGFGWTNGVILKYLSKYEPLLKGIDAPVV